MQIIQNATSIDELVQAFASLLAPTPSPVLKGKRRLEANRVAKEILEKYNGDFSTVTDEDKAALRQYSGLGGIGGSINEYYTPEWVAKAAWDALKSYGFTGGNILEPSSGVGIFSETKPKSALSTSVEYDPTSAAINKILHPEDDVINASFEAVASNPDFGGFDAVIGNPPFGDRMKLEADKDPAYAHITDADQYFVSRSIDKTKAGGLIALLLPTRIVDAPRLADWRTEIAQKAEFLGAHRLPSGVFNGSPVVTDLVIWRKHSDEAIEAIEKSSKADLEAANVLWATWLTGKWFDKDGKKFINGDVAEVKGMGGRLEKTVKRGKVTNEQISNNLSKRFKSRIDWQLLQENLIEPQTEAYQDGDTIFRNRTQYQLTNGIWVAVSDSTTALELDRKTYGIDDLNELRSVTSQLDSMLSISGTQAVKLLEDYPSYCGDDFKPLVREIAKLPVRDRNTAYQAAILGQKVKTLSNYLAESTTRAFGIDEDTIFAYRERLGVQLTEFNAKSKSARTTQKALAKLDSKVVSDIHAYASAIDRDGKLSELITGDVKVEKAVQYNASKIDDVFHLYARELGRNSLTINEIRESYTSPTISGMSDDQLTAHIAAMDGIAINQDGSFSAMHHACTGMVGKRVSELRNLIADTDNDVIRENCMRQIKAIDAKRQRIPMSEVESKITDNWIPKHIILEFLHEQGYDGLMLGEFYGEEIPVTKNGEPKLDEQGNPVTTTKVTFEESIDGSVFGGYRTDRNGKKKSHKDDQFARHLESYLNERAINTGSMDNVSRSLLREKLQSLDEKFARWLSTSLYADDLEETYNNTFNGWIKPAFDDAPLGLQDVSGSIELMRYQNATIRRHSADGNGIVAFGTGLGKTLTGLGLIQYNLQNRRASRVAIIVPKSTLENWFYESELFFGEANLGDKVFVGLKVVRDKNGTAQRETVYESDGKTPRRDKKGDVITRVKLKLVSNKIAAQQLHEVTQSNVKIVVMTKDVYGAIPIKEQTLSDNADLMVDAAMTAGSGKYVIQAKNYTEAKKNLNFRNKHSAQGTDKNKSFPFFEDLLFDSVMVDEAHEFRNSSKGGNFQNRLKFLPNQTENKRSVDMQVKNNLIKSRNNDRGVYFLTATPTVNSPIDIYNMLAHIVPAETFAKMGIVDSDDFVRMFGKTGEAEVVNLAGETYMSEALLGFQNLDALRNIINRYVTMEDIKSVGSDAHIPELVDNPNPVEMSDEQKEIYRELQKRAKAANEKDPTDPELMELKELYPADKTFGIIRKMDKLSTDPDLYHEVVTFRFNPEDESAVAKALDSLPDTAEIKEEQVDDNGKIQRVSVTVDVDKSISNIGGFAVVKVRQELAEQFIDTINDAKLAYSHPVSPKIAKFLENAKVVYLSGGKQLVFSEEKTQHKKLAKIISDYLGLPMSEIGILNSDTVAGKSGSKATDDDDTDGLEEMATAYNTGKYKIMILNRKGEVGINLHHGTVAVHHLTIPFTPMSITQRNGRAARVGSKASHVQVHYYASKGSFDDNRLRIVKRKANWIDSMFKGSDKFVANEEMDDQDDIAILLADNPEEERKAIAERKAKKALERKVRQARIATDAVAKYQQLKRDLTKPISEYEQEVERQTRNRDDALERIQKLESEIAASDEPHWRTLETLEDYKRALVKYEQGLRIAQNKLAARKNAENALTRIESEIQDAINNGTLGEYPDILTELNSYKSVGGRLLRIGYAYNALVPEVYGSDVRVPAVVILTEFGRRSEMVSGKTISVNGKASERYVDLSPKQVLGLADVDMGAVEREEKLKKGVPLHEVSKLVDRERFYEMLNNNTLTKYGDSFEFFVRNETLGFMWKRLNHGDDMSIVVYPDPTDEALKREVADKIANGTGKGFLARRSAITDDIKRALFGDNFEQELAKYGNTASKADVIKTAQSKIQDYEINPISGFEQFLDDRDKAIFRTEYYGDVEAIVDAIPYDGFMNKTEIRQWHTEVLAQYREELEQRRTKHNEHKVNVTLAQFDGLVKEDASRAERLSSIAEMMARYKQEHTFKKKVAALYTGSPLERSLVLKADLQTLGLFELGDPQFLLKHDEFDTYVEQYRRVFSGYKSELTKDDFIEKYSKASQPITGNVAVTEKQKEVIEQLQSIDIASIDDFKKALAAFDVVIELVTGPTLYKEKKKTTYTTYPAGSYLALRDSAGWGAVAKSLVGNKVAKAEWGAKFLYECSCENADVTGNWWFINANSDLKVVADLIISKHK